MIYIVFILFCIGFFLELIHCYSPSFKINKNWDSRFYLVYSFLILVCILIASFREYITKLPDYDVYINYFKYNEEKVEITFKFFTFLIKSISHESYIVLFIIYAFLGVIFKSIGIFKLSPFFFCSFAIYLSFFYPLHELIQIRAGVAAGLGLISIKYICDKNKKLFFLIISFACLFHISALLFFPLYFLNTNTFNIKYWISLILLSFILSIFLGKILLSFFESSPLFYLLPKIANYANENALGQNIERSLFDKFLIFNYILIIYFLLNLKKLKKNYNNIYLFVKIFIISLMIKIIFNDLIPVLASRASELLYIVIVVLIPLCIYNFKKKINGLSFVFVLGLVYLIIIYNRLLVN